MASLGGSWQGEARTCEGREAEPIRNQPTQLPVYFLQQDCKEFSSSVLRIAPHPTRLRRATFTFYCIAATGSYNNFDSLRDAPPQVKAIYPLIRTGSTM